MSADAVGVVGDEGAVDNKPCVRSLGAALAAAKWAMKSAPESELKHSPNAKRAFADLAATVDSLVSKEARRVMLPGQRPKLGLEDETLDIFVERIGGAELEVDQRVYAWVRATGRRASHLTQATIDRSLSRCGLDDKGNPIDSRGRSGEYYARKSG
jgi:hypothetical protein